MRTLLPGLTLACLVPALNARGAPAAPVPRYSDVTKSSGIEFVHRRGGAEKDYIVETKGGGLAVFDYDNDGRDDIYFVNGSTFEDMAKGTAAGNKLYRNEGNWRFTDVTARAGLADRGWGIAAAAGDYDNDGRTDLYVSNWGADHLYRNRGDGTFDDVTAVAGITEPDFNASALFVDLDRDGLLDLYVTTYLVFEKDKVPRRGESRTCHIGGIPIMIGPVGLPTAHSTFYHNNGNGTFADWSVRAGFRAVKPGYALGAIACDVDLDNRPDLYIANDSTPNFLFRNKGDGTVEEIGFQAGVAYGGTGMAQAGMGVDMGDLRGTGREDILVANFENDTNTFYANDGDCLFSDWTHRSGIAEPSYPYVGWGVLLLDANCDRTLDLMIGNGHVVPQADRVPGNPGFRQINQLFLNDGAGRFREVTAQAGPGFAVKASTRGTACADLDGDGDLDLVCNNIDGPPTVLRCEGPPLGSWFAVRLTGTKSNRFGVGAWVALTDEKGVQLRYLRGERSWGSHSELVARFGLGDARAPARVAVLWPSGRAEEFPAGVPNRLVTLTEGEGAALTRPFFPLAR